MVAGYGTGQIRLYEAVTGILHAEINAHARWIYSLDIAPFSGLVSWMNQFDKNSFFFHWQFIMLALIILESVNTLGKLETDKTNFVIVPSFIFYIL